MTLTLPYSEIKYVSNGVIDTYSFSSFSLQNLNQLLVDIYDVSGNLVNPALYPYDANITDPTSDLPENSIVFSDDVPPENYIIILSRLTEQTQEVSFSTLGGYNSKTLENILSKIVQMIQEESYKLEHGVPALNPLQTDWIFDRLLTNNSMLYIDTINKVIKQTSFPKENVVQATGGMYLRRVLQNGYYIIEYSMDNITWTPILNGGAADYHNNLLGRDVANAHPASAITGVAEHIADTNNPHSVTKAQVGLGNVDNTSDENKPISTATQTALDLKANLSGATFTGDIEANNLSGTNTGDQDLSGYAELSGATFTGDISANNLSGTNTGDQDLSGYALDNSVVHLSGNETIADVKTFSSFPETPSSAPTTDYQVANKKYVDDNAGGGSAILPTGTCSTAGATAAKEVSVSGYTETVGARALITFENKNSALGPDLYIPFTGGTAADPLGVYTLTTIGSPTYTDDKFNSNGNTGLSYNITSLGSGSWCIQGKFKSTNNSTQQYLIRGVKNFSLILRKTSSNILQLNLSSSGSSWNLASSASGSKSNWDTGTEYYIRLRFTGAAYYVDWSTDGITWTNDITIASSTSIYSILDGIIFGLEYDLSSFPFIGTIDDLYVSTGSATTITDYPTLNINGGGAKYLCHADGTRITPANPAYFIANCPIQFCYDGTGYRFKQEVAKTYSVGASWYRLYKSGWVEQGGHVSADGTVTLIKPMLSTNYSILFGSISGNGVPKCTVKTTTTFTYSSANVANTAADWRIEGMAA